MLTPFFDFRARRQRIGDDAAVVTEDFVFFLSGAATDPFSAEPGILINFSVFTGISDLSVVQVKIELFRAVGKNSPQNLSSVKRFRFETCGPFVFAFRSSHPSATVASIPERVSSAGGMASVPCP